jgi:hypothetical protein
LLKYVDFKVLSLPSSLEFGSFSLKKLIIAYCLL